MFRAAVVVVLATVGVSAQSSQVPSRTFEVVSVKPAFSPSELGRQAAETGGQFPVVQFGIRTFPGGRLTAYTNVRTMIARAYQGPGLKPTSPECLAQIEARKSKSVTVPSAPSRPPQVGQCGTWMTMGSSSGVTTWSVSGQPLSALVDSLNSELGSPVVDRTGLEGLFDFVVEHESQRTAIALGGQGGLDPNSTESPKPPLRIAIERQLGLKLESVQGEIPTLVIDAAERPKPN